VEQSLTLPGGSPHFGKFNPRFLTGP